MCAEPDAYGAFRTTLHRHKYIRPALNSRSRHFVYDAQAHDARADYVLPHVRPATVPVGSAETAASPPPAERPQPPGPWHAAKDFAGAALGDAVRSLTLNLAQRAERALEQREAHRAQQVRAFSVRAVRVCAV